MTQATRDQARRQRLRDYEATLAAAREPIGVLVLFARAREIRGHGGALEEAFAVTPLDGVPDEDRLPASVWVALRQGDVDAAVDALTRVSRHEVVIGVHEELDAGYKLTTVEERRTVPDVPLLEAQVAAFLQIPRDVVSIITSWGPDDPRTAAEIETLLRERFGQPVSPTNRQAPAAPGSDAATAMGRPRRPTKRPSPTTTSRATISMSSDEFTAMLNLSDDQQDVLAVLVRQADVTVCATDEP
jgi:hypothetical protein